MKNECGMPNAESGRNADPPRCAPAFSAIPHSPLPIPHSSRGITLIELLITMTIIAIISALIMGTAAAAIENAREKRTQALITKIHTLVMERYASYEGRRVPLDIDFVESVNKSFQNADRGKALADVRLLAARELMKYEMPDRWSDILNDPEVLESAPPLAMQYRRLYYGGPGTADDATTNNQGAECLYAFVMYATGDGEARSLFNKDQIGDVDGDGRNEFLDGWGQPISWLRWPTGLTGSPLMSGDAENDHDPVDIYRRDQLPTTAPGPLGNQYQNPSGRRKNVQNVMNRYVPMLRDANPAFRIVPLIFSVGPDGEQLVTSKGNDYVADLDPYSAVEPGQASPDVSGVLPGTIHAGRLKDDLTNHLIEY